MLLGIKLVLELVYGMLLAVPEICKGNVEWRKSSVTCELYEQVA